MPLDRAVLFLLTDQAVAALYAGRRYRNVVERLRPYPSEAMRAYRVSTAVNSPKNDSPECIEPAA